MDFSIPPHIEEFRARIQRFVDDRLIPLESDPASYDEYENINLDLLAELRQETKAMGIWSLTMPVERGGMGLALSDIAVLYQEMNRSIFGPVCFNAAAPEDGNMWTLHKLGTEAQKDKWLQPIINGDLRSAIVMTEPAPGSGSDPSGMMNRVLMRVIALFSNFIGNVMNHYHAIEDDQRDKNQQRQRDVIKVHFSSLKF